jgi:hypothetical protein
MSPNVKIKVSEVATRMGCSHSTALKRLKDLQEEFPNIKFLARMNPYNEASTWEVDEEGWLKANKLKETGSNG